LFQGEKVGNNLKRERVLGKLEVLIQNSAKVSFNVFAIGGGMAFTEVSLGAYFEYH